MHFDFHVVLQHLIDQAYRLLAMLPMLVLAIIVVLLAWWIGGWISRRAVVGSLSRHNPLLREINRSTVRWLVTVAGILLALEILDATALVGAVLGTAGVLGVALGFAFKDILENYLAGILLSVRQPFAPRDHVVIDGNEGIVMALTSRATILMTLDGNHLRLPNALVFRGVTLNYTRNPRRRFEFDVGMGVNEDLVKAQRIGVAQLQSLEGILDTPPARAFIDALGDSNVVIRFHAWVDQRSHDFIQVKSESIRRVKLVLEEAGMDMPEPIYRVQLSERDDEGAAAEASRPAQVHESTPPDLRPNTDIATQIERDTLTASDADLLDEDAPRE
ncbi:MAG: mechanosensitive ion channel family protein [Rhodanobacteraceae bacterium]